MKNSNDTIGNQTYDIPTCSTMPQPTAPPRAPFVAVLPINLDLIFTSTVIKMICCLCAVSLMSSAVHVC